MVEFRVYGIPAPGGSKRAFPIHTGKFKPDSRTGKPVEIIRTIVTDAAGARNKNWRQSVQDACRSVFTSVPLQGPLSMKVLFYMPYRKGDFNAKGDVKETAPKFPITKPDVLKLMRSTEDALNGVLWLDDAQVVATSACKVYGRQPGALIQIESLNKGPSAPESRKTIVLP